MYLKKMDSCSIAGRETYYDIGTNHYIGSPSATKCRVMSSTCLPFHGFTVNFLNTILSITPFILVLNHYRQACYAKNSL